jgi:tRNA dimethylallyltransferase
MPLHMDPKYSLPALREFLMRAERPLIVVLGPTASGKTDYSVALAQALGEGEGETSRAEILNADSRQLYRHLDIGTAKITKEEARGVPHHLFDIADPKEEVTAARYKRNAVALIEEIHARHGVPVLVGGSMLYLSAVIDNLDFPAASDPALRAQLSAEYDADGGAALYAKLEELDPETAAAFSVRNKPYVLRALETHALTGEKPSDARGAEESPYDLHVIGIRWPRALLHERINARTRRQFQKGWMDEVRGLLQKGYGPEDPGMKSHGYREIMEFLQAEGTDREPLIESIAAQARQYAKRQMTWWRRDARIQWIDAA